MRKPDPENIKEYFDHIAPRRLYWKRRNSYYGKYLETYFSFLIPPGARVLELGCGTGELLNAVKPSYGVGIDFSARMLEIAIPKFPHLHFINGDAEDLSINETFDYIILSDLLHSSQNIHKIFNTLKNCTHHQSRIVISNFSYLWEFPFKLAEKLGLKQKSPISNWLSSSDIFNLLEIANFQLIKRDRKLLMPFNIPIVSYLVNRIAVNLPVINYLGMINFIVARPVATQEKDCKVSIIIPAKNEKGNIENAIKRTPVFGTSQEFIFMEGGSTDGTYEEVLRVRDQYREKNIRVMQQSAKGKANAVREGFEAASGDILMILDADLTSPPEFLLEFYNVLISNKAEFVNGCRLVYPMEKEAMRFLNLIANKLFGWIFSYLLGQHVKDTLCGTKVISKANYNKIRDNRAFFGDFDPFGDFDLLLGASKLNLKILEVYVKYKDREYGSTQISRFKHGWILLKMTCFAARKLKLN